MNLNYGLRLEQTQKLIMTPELRQAIKILQLSYSELSEYVNEMVTENPLIEIKEEEYAAPRDKDRDEPVKKEKENEIDWDYYLDDNFESQEYDRSREVKAEVPFENYLKRGVSLQEHLLTQLGYLSLNKDDYRTALYLIGNIDPSGYLSVAYEQAAADLQVPLAQVERIIRRIQSFDPAGIGASNLSECLGLQLMQKGITDPVLYELIDQHLELIAAGKLNRAAQILNVPVARVQEMADLIKTLNPKPGASFGGGEIRYIIPDVTVERIEDDYIIYLNDNHIPHLTINKAYSSILKKSSNTDDTTRNFVENNLHQTHCLIRSIEQRRMTIFNVASALVKIQLP
ncbi:MAG: RNA polymerase sigma-54 factor, partial [Clostridia bacterium]|nr:RNA polymerase sigma-54 factor [Clostridia bacterium]